MEEANNDGMNMPEKGASSQNDKGVQEWCDTRSLFLGQFGKRRPDLQKVFVDFSAPEYGWTDMSIYFGGKLCYTQSLSNVFDPFPDLKRWLEQILKNGEGMLSEFCCDCEGVECRMIFESFYMIAEERNIMDTGILYINDTGKQQTVCAYCDKRQLVRAFYLALKQWHRKSYSKMKMWIEDEDEDENEDEGGWRYYNRYLRSSTVEYYITGHDCRWDERFEQTAIGERLHMRAIFGDFLFWSEPKGCCGNADSVHTDTHGEISFKETLPELRTWYDDFNNNAHNSRFDWDRFKKRGEELAVKVRQLLPDDIELLFECGNFPGNICKHHLKDFDEFKFNQELPMIVFNERLRKRRYLDTRVFRKIIFMKPVDGTGFTGICFNLFGRRFFLSPTKLMKILAEKNGVFTANATEQGLQTCEVHFIENYDSVVWLARMQSGEIGEACQLKIPLSDYLDACEEAFLEALKWYKAKDKPDEKQVKELASYCAQMKAVRALHTPPYRLYFKNVKVSDFAFSCAGEECDLPIRITIGGHTLSTNMSDWTTNLDCLRMRLEALAFPHEMAQEVRFYFEDSPTIITLSKACVLDSTENVGPGIAFHWHDGLVFVTVEPDEFSKAPVLFGLCERKKVLQQIYEGLLRPAIFCHSWGEDGEWDDLTNLQFYNKIKSPIVEAEISGTNGYCKNNVPDLRQVVVKHLLVIRPDIDEVGINENNTNCMWFEDNDMVEVAYHDIKVHCTVPGFKAWYDRYKVATDFADNSTDPTFNYPAWHDEGIRLAEMLRQQLDDCIDLWYGYPHEDKQKSGAAPMLIYKKDYRQTDS